MNKVEKEIIVIADYLGCNDGELVSEIKMLLQEVTHDEVIEFIHS